MATTSISALTETTTINGVTVGPFDYAGTTYKVTANTLGAFINTNAVTITATGNIQGGNLNAAGLSLTSNVVSALNSTANITTTANITGGNVLFGSGIINGSGNITGGNILFGSGIVSGTGTITGSSLLGSVASLSGNVTSGNVLFGAGVISGTGNISCGNLIAGNILTVNAGSAVTAIVNGAANAVGNIGSSTKYFNQLFAQATTALYADLAEVYEADTDYAPGTVVSFGGSKEVTISTSANDTTVAGVISANPSYLMNNGLTADHRAIVALTGRVPTNVTGTVSKGAMMVSAGNGYAQACSTPAMGTVIGKALENFNGKSGIIEIVVGRM
jgi:hypothetical protein